MDAFAKMDIFFVVTTITVVVIAVFVAILLFYILRTAKDISEVVHIVRKESERFIRGVSVARNKMQGSKGSALQNIIAFVQSFTSTKRRTKKDTK